jgi:hypothetical protein
MRPLLASLAAAGLRPCAPPHPGRGGVIAGIRRRDLARRLLRPVVDDAEDARELLALILCDRRRSGRDGFVHCRRDV